jgi:arylsulfatase A-like enzyme
MPYLDQLAQESTLFEYAYTPAWWTLPAHASLFTGTSVSRHGICKGAMSPQKLSNRQLVTLPEFLCRAGYQTVGFSGAAAISRDTLFDRGFDDFYEPWKLIEENHPLYVPLRQMSDFFGKNWVWRINWLYESRWYRRRDKGAAKTLRLFQHWLDHIWDRRRPFFAFLHLFEAHAAYWPPATYRQAFLNGYQAPKELALRHAAPWAYYNGEIEISDAEFELLTALYDAELLYLDSTLQGLCASLLTYGVLENTLVIITADHGECLGEHGYFQHTPFCIYEPLIRVPLVIRHPALFPARQRISTPVSLYDLFPTIAEVAGLEARHLAHQWQGKCIAPTRVDFLADRPVFVEALNPLAEEAGRIHSEVNAARYDYYLRAVRWQHYKLIWHSKGAHELYDVRADPTERVNLIHREPALAYELQRKLENWLESFEPDLLPSDSNERDELHEETVRRLRALGYVDF